MYEETHLLLSRSSCPERSKSGGASCFYSVPSCSERLLPGAVLWNESPCRCSATLKVPGGGPSKPLSASTFRHFTKKTHHTSLPSAPLAYELIYTEVRRHLSRKETQDSLTFDAFLQHCQVTGNLCFQFVDFKCSRSEKKRRQEVTHKIIKVKVGPSNSCCVRGVSPAIPNFRQTLSSIAKFYINSHGICFVNNSGI